MVRDSSDWSNRDREVPRARRASEENEPHDAGQPTRSDSVWPPDPRQSSVRRRSGNDPWPDSTDPGNRLRPGHAAPRRREPNPDLPRTPAEGNPRKSADTRQPRRPATPAQTSVRRAVGPQKADPASRAVRQPVAVGKRAGRRSSASVRGGSGSGTPGRGGSGSGSGDNKRPGRGPAWLQTVIRGVKRIPRPIRWSLVGIVGLICLSTVSYTHLRAHET